MMDIFQYIIYINTHYVTVYYIIKDIPSVNLGDEGRFCSGLQFSIENCHLYSQSFHFAQKKNACGQLTNLSVTGVMIKSNVPKMLQKNCRISI